MIFHKIYLTMILLFFYQVQANQCLVFLEDFHSKQTLNFIAYYNALLENGKLDTKNLEDFIENNISVDVLLNPISFQDQRQSSEFYIYYIYYFYFNSILEKTDIQKSKILNWAKAKFLEMRDETQHKTEAKKKTTNLFDPPTFIKIEPGSFLSARKAYHHSGESKIQGIEITYPFLVAQTVVTQGQWVDVVGFNKEKLPGQKTRKNKLLENLVFGFESMAPMEKSSLWSKMFFANILSASMGLPEAYPLDINDFTGTINGGDLRPKTPFTEQELEAITPDPAITMGFRIMTEAEYTYVAGRRGQVSPRSAVSDIFPAQANITEYIHKSDLDAVTSVLPLRIEGQNIWGLYGFKTGELVYGSNADVFNVNPPFPFEVDPYEPINSYTTVMGLQENRPNFKIEQRHFVDVNNAFKPFRIVRTLGDNK